MAAPDAVVDDLITANLTIAGVRAVLDSVWAIDCQACGGPLGSAPPALAVDDLETFAQAALYHCGCRASEWSEHHVLVQPETAVLTWRAVLAVLPVSVGGPVRMLPTMVLNPTLEAAYLQPGPDGRWSVGMFDTWAAAGLTDPRRGVDLERPVAGGVVRLGRDDLAVTLSDLLEARTYTARLGGPAVRELVTGCGGVLLAVTNAVNPDDVTEPEHLEPVLAGDRSLLGWVELDTVRAARPTPAPVLTGRTLLLHHSKRHLITGEVLAHQPRLLSATKAKAWAVKTTGDTRGLTVWQALSDGGGYAGLEPLSGRQVALLRYADGWRLVAVASRADGDIAQTETEARAWAARVLEIQAKIAHRQAQNLPGTPFTVPAWAPGPTPGPGVTTLYADA